MAELNEELRLDIGQALSSVQDIQDAFDAVVEGFGQSLSEALVSVDVEALTETIREAASVGATDIPATVGDVEAGEVRTSIEEAAASAETRVEIEDVDASAVSEAIEDAAESASASVQAFGETSEQALGATGEAADGTANKLSGLGVATTALTGGTQNLARVTAAFQGNLGAAAKSAGPYGAAIAGAGALTGVFFNEAKEAAQANERFERTFGSLQAEVEKIELFGLNTSIQDLAAQTGSSDDAIREIISTLGVVAKSAGVPAPAFDAFSENLVALAAQISVTNPALGTMDEVLAVLAPKLARGGRATQELGLSLNAADIEARALHDTGKELAEDLTQTDKAMAGAAIAAEQLGPRLKKDIAEGSKSATIETRALKQSLQETIEEAGAPLVEPVVDAFRSFTPVLTGLARVVGGILTTALKIIGPILKLTGDVLGFVFDKGFKLANFLGTELPAKLGPAGAILKGLVNPIGAIGDLFDVLTGKSEKSKKALDDLPGAAQGAADGLAVIDPAIAKAETALSTAVARSLGPFGASFVDLQTIVRNSAGGLKGFEEAVGAFVAGIEGRIPSIEEVFGKFKTSAEVNLKQVTKTLEARVKDQETFFLNVQRIIDKGGADTAISILKLGPVEGAAFASATAAATPARVKALEAATDAVNKAIAAAGQKSGELYALSVAKGANSDAALKAIFTAGSKTAKELDSGFKAGAKQKSPSIVAMELGKQWAESLFSGVLSVRSDAGSQLARSLAIGTPTSLVSSAATGPAPSTTNTTNTGPINVTIHGAQAPDEALAFKVGTEILRKASR